MKNNSFDRLIKFHLVVVLLPLMVTLAEQVFQGIILNTLQAIKQRIKRGKWSSHKERLRNYTHYFTQQPSSDGSQVAMNIAKIIGTFNSFLKKVRIIIGVYWPPIS